MTLFWAPMKEYKKTYGKPFPDKDRNKYNPEKPQSFLLHHRLLPFMQSFEELDGGHKLGIDGKSGVH